MRAPMHSLQLAHWEGAVQIQRDDLLHPLVSGNKWRKLKGFLRKAHQEQCSHLLSFGGAYSNHLLALACAGASFGLNTYGVVRGDEGFTNHYLRMCQWMGMQLQFVSREAYRDKAACTKAAIQQIGLDEERVMVIPEGGNGEEAKEGWDEFLDQLLEEPRYLVLALGTGACTQSLLKGLIERDWSTQVVAVPVLKLGEAFKESMEKVYGERLLWAEGYEMGGYGKTREDHVRFCMEASRQTGILFDQVYTGKSLFALDDLLKKGQLPYGKGTVYLHTGGSMGWFSESHQAYVDQVLGL